MSLPANPASLHVDEMQGMLFGGGDGGVATFDVHEMQGIMYVVCRFAEDRILGIVCFSFLLKHSKFLRIPGRFEGLFLLAGRRLVLQSI